MRVLCRNHRHVSTASSTCIVSACRYQPDSATVADQRADVSFYWLYRGNTAWTRAAFIAALVPVAAWHRQRLPRACFAAASGSSIRRLLPMSKIAGPEMLGATTPRRWPRRRIGSSARLFAHPAHHLMVPLRIFTTIIGQLFNSQCLCPALFRRLLYRR